VKIKELEYDKLISTYFIKDLNNTFPLFVLDCTQKVIKEGYSEE